MNIRNQAITFVVAGHETTSGALSFALYYLTHHPELLARARAEVDAVWGDREPEFAGGGQAARRRVLDAGVSGVAREDVLLGGRYPMHPGDWVIVPLPLLHRDPAAWGPDADSFDPDRFEPAAVRGRPAHAYKPFSTGERACIGRQFALHEALLALGLVLQRYDLEADPDYRLADLTASATDVAGPVAVPAPVLSAAAAGSGTGSGARSSTVSSTGATIPVTRRSVTITWLSACAAAAAGTTA